MNTPCGFTPLAPRDAQRMLESGKAILIDLPLPEREEHRDEP
jgi:hypothetical protein